MKTKPQRMCAVCRQHKDNNEMVRIVKTKNGEFFVDKDHKKEGRGAYICLDDNCLKNFEKSKALNRAFRCEVPEEIYAELKEVLGFAKSANK